MEIRHTNSISSYEDLIKAKQHLKDEIISQEFEIKNNKVIKFTSSIANGEPFKNPLMDSIKSIELKDVISGPLGKLLSTFILTNKTLRKYFLAFTIIKETVPYAFQKLKDILDQVETSKKSHLD